MAKIVTTNIKSFKSWSLRADKQHVKTARGRSNSSVTWLKRHFNDPYVALARKMQYRSRAAFKLLEIDEKFQLLKGAKCILDLGAAPGSWLQLARQKSHNQALVLGVDLQEVAPLEGVISIQGDFNKPVTIEQIIIAIAARPVDLIMSDMAVSACGDARTDYCRSIALVEAAYEFALKKLIPGGNFLAKALCGGEEHILMKEMKKNFNAIRLFKPEASYKNSTEKYFIALDKKP